MTDLPRRQAHPPRHAAHQLQADRQRAGQHRADGHQADRQRADRHQADRQQAGHCSHQKLKKTYKLNKDFKFAERKHKWVTKDFLPSVVIKKRDRIYNKKKKFRALI